MTGTLLLRDGVVDLTARRVWRVGTVARLSGAEVDVLSLLGDNVGRTVGRQEILVQALNFPRDSLSRAVDLCVHRLRSKVERDPAHPVHLITIQGEGYRLVPAARVEDVRTNVVPARTPMVGRGALLDRVRAALDDGPVVLLGPAGAGKSRVAHAVATDAGRSWAPAGSWWIDLAEIGDLEEGIRAVAAVVGVDADTLEALGALGARGPSLVVLDTCERGVEVAAQIARALEGHARVLLTSRVEIPGVSGIEVPPLDQADAVALLVDRAGGDRPLDPAAVARLVEAVDRLPLAIELAAARLSAMPLARVEQELVRPLRLLRDRAGSGRQASVEASIRWSWAGLTEEDRGALVQLSVFRGPVPDDAALALISPGAADRLVAAHLVRRAAGGVVPWHAVKEFAASESAPEVWQAAAVRHAEWVARFAARWVPLLWGPRYAEALATLEGLEPDLAAAEAHLVDGAVVHARAEVAFEASAYTRVIAMVDAALPRLSPDDPHRGSIGALAAMSVGKTGDWVGTDARARGLLAEARTPRDRVEASYVSALALARTGHEAEARALAAEGLVWAGDDPVLRARALGTWMFVHLNRRADPQGLIYAREALDSVRLAQVERLVSHATHNLAVALIRAGQLEEALPTLRESVGRFGRNRRACGIARMNLAVLQARDDIPMALGDAEQALEAFRDAGSLDGERVALGLCGLYRTMVGELVDGLADLDEVYARLAGSPVADAIQPRAVRAVALAIAGQHEAARAAFAEIRPDLATRLTASEALAEVFTRAWLDGVPVSAESMAQMEQVVGDRMWLHAQVLRATGRVAT